MINSGGGCVLLKGEGRAADVVDGLAETMEEDSKLGSAMDIVSGNPCIDSYDRLSREDCV